MWRKTIRILLVLAASAAAVLASALAYSFWNYSQPPVVFLTNHTGHVMLEVRIAIDTAEVRVGTLQDGATVRKKVPFKGSEASTKISWVDQAHRPHEGGAGDYVEGVGGYRTNVVVMPDNSVKAVYRKPSG